MFRKCTQYFERQSKVWISNKFGISYFPLMKQKWVGDEHIISIQAPFLLIHRIFLCFSFYNNWNKDTYIISPPTCVKHSLITFKDEVKALEKSWYIIRKSQEVSLQFYQENYMHSFFSFLFHKIQQPLVRSANEYYVSNKNFTLILTKICITIPVFFFKFEKKTSPKLNIAEYIKVMYNLNLNWYS